MLVPQPQPQELPQPLPQPQKRRMRMMIHQELLPKQPLLQFIFMNLQIIL